MSVWDRMYRANIWAGRESRSGPGSGTEATRRTAADIVDLVARYGFETVLDIGCGDGFWMPDLPGYVGLDVSGVAIDMARARHPGRRYARGDLLSSRLTADLAIVRDVIQHLPLRDGQALVALARGRARYVLVSTYRGGWNSGIEPDAIANGYAYPPDLEAPPFSLPPPIEVIPDGWAPTDGDVVSDPRKVLGLW